MRKKIFKCLMNFKFKSIQSSIAFVFSCLIVVSILFIALLIYRLSADVEEKNSREFTYQLIEQVNANIESYINNMESISEGVMNSQVVQDYFSSNEFLSNDERSLKELKINELFNTILSNRKDKSSIEILGYDKKFISNRTDKLLNTSADLQKQEWYIKATEADGKAIISSSHVQNILKKEYPWVVTLARELKTRDGSKKLGVLLIDLNYNIINDMCKKIKLGKRGYIFIIDNNGDIVYHPQQQLIYSDLITENTDAVLKTKEKSFVTKDGNESKMFTIKSSDYTGWKIVGVAYVNELVANKGEMQLYSLLGGIICVIIAILLSIILSRRISRPLKKLEASMMEVEKGNFDIKVSVENQNEIGELSKAYNIMIAKIKDLIAQNTKEQELKRKSELKVLQAQINPHFLYNTLDSIIWMAENRNIDEVIDMTASLAKLFRISLSKGDEIISIFNEVEHIKNYLTIQKIRYLEKLDFSINIDKDIINFKTLKLILQPLVENSIYHGIKNKNGNGFIEITGSKVEGRILLQIKDNGIGMTQDILASILDIKRSSHAENGVGVFNVNERIKLYFGDEYGLVFESEKDIGTSVNLWIPILE